MGALRIKKCEVDQAVFYQVEKDSLIALAVHVDDCSAVAASVELEQEIKRELKKAFEISDLGEINRIQGIAVKRDRSARTIALSQKSYITSMVTRYGFENIKPLAMPMDPSKNLSSSQCPKTAQEFAEMKTKSYGEAVGSLMYASLGTRPDITYAVSILLKFAGLAHWNAVKRVFAYLAGTKDLWLTLMRMDRCLRTERLYQARPFCLMVQCRGVRRNRKLLSTTWQQQRKQFASAL
jgi:hypothetical protein